MTGSSWSGSLCAVVIGVVLFGLSTEPTVAQATDISVRGRVSNVTLAGQPVSGAAVVFHSESLTAHVHEETTTDGDGRFIFEGIVHEDGFSYGVTVTYQGALYGADIDLSAGSPPAFTLAVYESTGNQDVISLSNVSILLAQVDVATQTIWALEIVEVVNKTGMTYVPGPQPMSLLRFGLPPGATELEVDTGLLGADLIQVDRGFAITASVPPGEHEVMYAYLFPYAGDHLELSRAFPYGATGLRVLASSEVGRLVSADLEGPDTVDIGGRSLQLLVGTDLSRGGRITFSLVELPNPSMRQQLWAQGRDIPFEFAAIIGLAVLMMGIITFSLWKRRGPGVSSQDM